MLAQQHEIVSGYLVLSRQTADHAKLSDHTRWSGPRRYASLIQMLQGADVFALYSAEAVSVDQKILGPNSSRKPGIVHL